MREVKFRGKSDIDNKWLYGSLINNAFFLATTGESIVYILDTDRIDYDCFEHIANQIDEYTVFPKTVGEYTGLKDRNGVEIYEGDICFDELNDCHGLVKFDEAKFVYEWENICEDLFEANNSLIVDGNIYENPELLKE